jgi:hypothetical protein
LQRSSPYMLRTMPLFFRLLLPILSVFAPVMAAAEPRAAQLVALAPDAPAHVLAMALEARECASELGAAPSATRLAVIDFSLPSTERRLWLFDLETDELLYVEHVAHGRGSGDNLARLFSNVENSHQSSLGLFRTDETYYGGNGYSLRLDGLEPGTNDRARERLIVIHGADYVNPNLAVRQGRLGRSFGCPAVRPQVARALIDHLKHGQLLFAYYPDPDWLAHSPFLGCRQRLTRTETSADGSERTTGTW